MKRLITEFPVDCKICSQSFKKLEGLSKHLKLVHNVNTIQYTKEYLLSNEIPKCKCGCGSNVKVYNYRYNEYCLGHTGGGLWQMMYDKNSDEYKKICEKIGNSISTHYKENPIIRTDEQKKMWSIAKKKWDKENPEKVQEKIRKMTETKRRQSEDGTLSECHWTNTKSDFEIDEILEKSGKKISETKKRKFASGELIPWNRDSNKYIDARIAKYSGKNHYRWTPYQSLKYRDLFRNREYRNMLLELQSGVCFTCQDVPNGKSLCLHHIDGDPTRNGIDNLIFLCRSCHTRVHNNRMYRNDVDLQIFYFKEKIKNDIRIDEFKRKYNLEI